jgi:copper chaperone CopZ
MFNDKFIKQLKELIGEKQTKINFEEAVRDRREKAKQKFDAARAAEKIVRSVAP